MKKLTAITASVLICLMVFTACDTIGSTVSHALEGTVEGSVGKTYRTKWFEFNISSIEEAASYAGYTPDDGYTLYVMEVYEKNTFDEPIPMGTADFFMDAEVFEDYIFPLGPIDDTMMPSEFLLEPGDEAEYTVVFEIPEGIEGLRVCYTEIDVNDEVGAQFAIAVG